MREKMKRFTAAILAMVTMISTFFSNGVPVFAASESANIAFWVASARDDSAASGEYIQANDRWTYIIE